MSHYQEDPIKRAGYRVAIIENRVKKTQQALSEHLADLEEAKAELEALSVSEGA